jgi:hypothetical protein
VEWTELHELVFEAEDFFINVLHCG